MSSDIGTVSIPLHGKPIQSAIGPDNISACVSSSSVNCEKDYFL